MAARKKTNETLAQRYPDLRDSNVTDFVLSESRYIIDALDSDVRNVGTRATAQVGFAGTVAAIVAGLHAVIPAWAQIAGGLLLFVSIAISVAALFLLSIAFPTLDEYPTYENAIDPANKARIGLELAASYQDYITDLTVLLSKKARFLQASLVCFGLAVALLIVSVIT